MPRSAATCEIGRPLSSANRTPRSSSSSGYFLGLDMTADNLLSPGQHPRIEVPAKPGPAHDELFTPREPSNRARAYRKHGDTLNQIAKHLGCSYSTISRRLRREDTRVAP
jgi:hypothetical protein